ncbi:MAG: DUF4870 domain-containing protein [Bacillota bacterium]
METQTNENKSYSKEDIEKNTVMAVLAYIIFLIPLLAAKDSPYAQYHTNQGLVLFLAAVIINVIGSFIPIIGWFFVLTLGNAFVLILAIMGIINAVQGKAKPLPLIGSITLLK